MITILAFIFTSLGKGVKTRAVTNTSLVIAPRMGPVKKGPGYGCPLV